jgi:hypothetical protein
MKKEEHPIAKRLTVPVALAFVVLAGGSAAAACGDSGPEGGGGSGAGGNAEGGQPEGGQTSDGGSIE